MEKVDDSLLDRMVEAIIEEVDPELILLFGSRASGKVDGNSDVDLVVVERDPFGPHRPRKNELTRIRNALSSFRVPKDILVYSEDEMEKWKDSINHVLAQALREGKLLYERY